MMDDALLQTQVRFSESDADTGHMSVPALVRSYQDLFASWRHELDTEKLLRDAGYKPVIATWFVVIKRLPAVYAPVTLRMWPSRCRGRAAIFNFIMTGADGESLSYAQSMWAALGIATNRSEDIPASVCERYAPYLEPALQMPDLSRKIPTPGVGRILRPFNVQHRHLDANSHMNNVEMLSEALYATEITGVSTLRAEYRKQAMLGDLVQPVVSGQDGAVYISLKDRAGEAYANIAVNEVRSAL